MRYLLLCMWLMLEIDGGSPKYLGAKTNGTVWPSLDSLSHERDESDEEDEVVDELEAPVNLRLLRLGMFRGHFV